MNYEVINNFSFPMVSDCWVGASAQEELEVHVTSDDGVDVVVFVTVESEVTYSSSGDYFNPPEIETEESHEVHHESYGRVLKPKEIDIIYKKCVEIAYSL